MGPPGAWSRRKLRCAGQSCAGLSGAWAPWATPAGMGWLGQWWPSPHPCPPAPQYGMDDWKPSPLIKPFGVRKKWSGILPGSRNWPGLPWWLRWWRICLQCGRPEFDPWVGKIPLEEGMATHSLTWRIPWTEKPGGLQSMGSQRVGHEWSNLAGMRAPHIDEAMVLFLGTWPRVHLHHQGQGLLPYQGHSLGSAEEAWQPGWPYPELERHLGLCRMKRRSYPWGETFWLTCPLLLWGFSSAEDRCATKLGWRGRDEDVPLGRHRAEPSQPLLLQQNQGRRERVQLQGPHTFPVQPWPTPRQQGPQCACGCHCGEPAQLPVQYAVLSTLSPGVVFPDDNSFHWWLLWGTDWCGGCCLVQGASSTLPSVSRIPVCLSTTRPASLPLLTCFQKPGLLWFWKEDLDTAVDIFSFLRQTIQLLEEDDSL